MAGVFVKLVPCLWHWKPMPRIRRVHHMVRPIVLWVQRTDQTVETTGNSRHWLFQVQRQYRFPERPICLCGQVRPAPLEINRAEVEWAGTDAQEHRKKPRRIAIENLTMILYHHAFKYFLEKSLNLSKNSLMMGVDQDITSLMKGSLLAKN